VTTPATAPSTGAMLSAAQAGLWVNEQLGTAGGVYNMPFAVAFEGALDVARLVAAVEAVTRRHPALAARVADDGGVPRLVPAVTPPAVERVAEVDLDAFVRRLFDVATGPLSRFALARTGPDRHVLLAVAHHLVFDGQSTDVFLRDLARAYAAETLPPLPPPVPPDDDVEAARDFWRDRRREPDEPILPGRLGPSVVSAPGETVEFSLPATLADRLAAAGQTLGVSRFELVLASWHALLRRYGNEEPVVAVDLGTRTEADRDRIGLFVNEVPVAGRPAPDATFAGYVRQLRGELRELYRHRTVPLARAVPGIKPAVAFAPVTLTYRRRIAPPEFPGVPATVDWVVFCGSARGSLRVHLVDGPDGFDVMLQYSPEVLGAQAVRRIGAHWLTLLDAALSAPDTPIIGLPLLGDAERETLAAWNRTAVEFPPVTVLDLVARSPREALAVGTLTYADLDAAANRVAHRLRARGIGPGDTVSVCLSRGPELVVALLGVLKAGAAYLPLDPAHPQARRDEFVADAGAIPLPEDDGDDQPPGLLPEVSPADRAYVIYTSGSTGRPKGVAVGHAALANLLQAMRDELRAGPDTRFLAHTSVSFDISALELFLPLTAGGSVVIAGDDQARDAWALCRLVREHAVTHVQATPSGWRMLLEAGFAAPAVVALAGGEALPAPLAAEVRARVGRLLNVYGPTETTIWSTCGEVPPGVTEVGIGRPIANTTAWVLDQRAEPAPIGVPGELYLGGAGLAVGYVHGDAGRFPTVRGERLYRTGDLVRYAEDGSLRYLHRIDDQVKIRGYRIEPGEIEARLLAHPEVSAAAVAVRGGPDPFLVAYLVAPAPAPDALRAHLARTLPDYMLPSAYVSIDELPSTPNGKLDRRALPEPPSLPPRPAGGEEHHDPLTAQVAEICAEVLQCDAVGADDDLFDRGAHSLTLTAIASRIRGRLGADLPLHVYFDDPTPALLAAAIKASR
jgi:amino acid adenylation domain-containing protein